MVQVVHKCERFYLSEIQEATSYSKHRHRSLDSERDFRGSLKSGSVFSKLVPTNKFGPEFNLCRCGRDFSITDKFLLKEGWQCLSFLGEKKNEKAKLP